MKLICNCCQTIFNEEELVFKRDKDTGWSLELCPYCGNDDVSEAVKCERCGEWFAEDETVGDLCETCINELVHDEDCIKEYIADGHLKEFVEYLSSYFGKTIIDVLLKEFPKETKEFVKEDLDDFSDWWVKKNV